MSLFWLILFLLSALTYIAVRRSAAGLTRTPVWLLWLVMMTPAFIWTAWVVVTGSLESMPPLLLVIPFVVCPFIYWMLVQMGRPTPSSPNRPASSATAEPNPLPTQVPDAGSAGIRPITKTEETALQNCFPWSVFYLQNIEYRPQALVCRGKLRTSPEVAYRTIRENIEAQFGDRFLVVFQEGMNGSPFFALVSNPLITKRSNSQQTARPALMLGLLGATLVTTIWAGSLGVTGRTDALLPQDFATFLTGLPYSLALLTILGTHELGHYCASQVHRVRATLPYFIPVPPVGIFPFGTFGAFIQMKSPVPNRKALFDIGIAGPLAGLMITIPILLWGLSLSEVVPSTENSGILNFSSLQPTGSVLLLLLSKLALGGELAADGALNLHPVAIAGCLGLIVTALNLMPVGQLDGGHIVHAMFGQRMGALIGQVTRLLVLGLALVQPEFLLWAILLFFIPAVDEPALNDVSELNNARDALGLVALALLVLIVLPAPPLLLQMLGA